jgi:hypothetical protein
MRTAEYPVSKLRTRIARPLAGGAPSGPSSVGATTVRECFSKYETVFMNRGAGPWPATPKIPKPGRHRAAKQPATRTIQTKLREFGFVPSKFREPRAQNLQTAALPARITAACQPGGPRQAGGEGHVHRRHCESRAIPSIQPRPGFPRRSGPQAPIMPGKIAQPKARASHRISQYLLKVRN